MSETKKKRIQFDFSQDASDALDALVNETGAASKAEVVRKALQLYTLVQRGDLKLRDQSDSTVVIL